MAKLLYLESSPRKDRSASIQVARELLTAYQAAHPADTVETLDLWALDLPAFDGDTINAKYAVLHGLKHTEAQAQAWGRVVEVFRRFNAAEKYVFSVPMWNFGIPYRLKHFIDVITQPGLSFSYSPAEGYKGLMTGRPAAVIFARGGAYGSASGGEAMDFQKPYLETILRFIGFTDIRPIVIEPTMAEKGAVEKTIALAKEKARALGRTL